MSRDRGVSRRFGQRKARQHRHEQVPLALTLEVPRLGCRDCESRANALELMLRGLEVAQLSGAGQTSAASQETQDEGSVAAQLLGGVEMAVGVWQEEF